MFYFLVQIPTLTRLYVIFITIKQPNMLSPFTDGFFSVDPKHGFLPIAEPLAKLPETFSGLQSLIDEMPIVKDDGSSGLLATEGAFEKAVLALPNYVGDVQAEKDPFVLAALFRAYRRDHFFKALHPWLSLIFSLSIVSICCGT